MEKLIEISGLSKAYGKKQALHNVDMVFEGGQIIGLLGPNGSGKTTLLKVMTGLLKDYDGVVKIDGTCIGAETKAMVSYLPDEPYFSDSVSYTHLDVYKRQVVACVRSCAVKLP